MLTRIPLGREELVKITTDSFGVGYQREVKMRLNNKSLLLKTGLITIQRNYSIINLLKSFYRLANLNLKFGKHIGNRDFVKDVLGPFKTA